MNNLIINTLKRLTFVCLCATAFACFAEAQVASNGNYTLTQTATANGGTSGAGASSGGNYLIEGTIGQSAAGTKQQNAAYTFQPGFWTAQQIFAPTAAAVHVGGKVVTADGRGIRNVRVTLKLSNGEARTIISSTFGYFRFDSIPAGETCIFSVSAKQFTFSQPAQVRSIVEDTDDIVFTADNLKQLLAPQISDVRKP